MWTYAAPHTRPLNTHGVNMEKLCAHCREPRDAQSLCTVCNKWLCYQCTDMHQDHRTAGSVLLLDSGKRPTQRGSGCWSSGIPLCHFHKQEALDLFCESCDLLSCSSCHLATHRDHRVVHVGKALQNQLWLFENLMVQVDDKKSAVENTAKQIEDRLHGVKVMQRKAENQIKMAKMIMINELNKRANLLIEQLEKVSNEFKQHLEDQLQGMIELCSRLGHVQNVISWATAHHQRNPLLFSKELITFQMQRLLESQLRSDLDPPVKIKFNWDASFWTKQVSTLGQLTAEGGSRTHSVGVACSSVLKPRPIPCSALPTSLCHGALDQSCGFQARFQPQMCCPHCVNIPTPHPDLLMGHGRGSLGEHQGVRCHPIVGPYPKRTLQHGQLPQPEVRSAAELDRKQPETSACPIACVQPSQALTPLQHASPQGHCDPQGLPSPTAHTWHRPQQSVSMQAPPAGPADARLRSTGSPPPGEKQAAQSSLQLLLQPPQLRTERLPGARAQPAADGIWADPGERAQTQTAAGWRDADASPERSGSGPAAGWSRVSPGRQQQTEERTRAQAQPHAPPALESRTDQCAEQHSAELVQPLRNNNSDCRGSASPEMLALAHDLPSNAPCGPGSLRGRRPGSQSSSEEPAAILREAPSPLEAFPTRATSSPATAAGEQRPLAGQDGYTLPDERTEGAGPDGVGQGVALVVSPTPTPIAISPALPSSRTSGQMYACEDTGMGGRARLRISRKHRKNIRTAKDVPQGSRVPLVRLERLLFRLAPGQQGASHPPPRGHRHGGPLPEPPTEGAVASEPLRNPTSEKHQPKGRPDEKAELGIEVSRSSSRQDWSKERLAGGPAVRSVRTAPSPVRERPQEESSLRPEPEPDSGPESDSEPQSEFDPRLESEPDLGSEPEVGSKQRSESDPSLESEPQPESDSDTEVEHHPEPEAYLELESGVESDPDSDRYLEPAPDRSSEPGSEPHGSPGADMASGRGAESGPVPGAAPEHAGRSSVIERADRPAPAAGGGAPEEAGQMENEDFCAVCRNGGDLLCCDRCPKVFHLSCHVPPLVRFPTGDWVCSLCRDVLQPEVEYEDQSARLSADPAGKGAPRGLADCDQRRCEKLTLFISCNILSSPFHEPVSPLARHYYQIIKRPMDLSVIRGKLDRTSRSRYHAPQEFVADVFLMFRNCAKFNYPDSEVALAGRSLEAFFSSKLRDVFGDRAFPVPDDDSDSEEYEESYRAGAAGFPWPDRKEHCHRKRKRRHSLTSRRHHF